MRKKFTMLFAALLCTSAMTVVAETSYPFTITTDAENPSLYAIKSGRGDAYWYTYDSSDGKIALSAYTGAQTQYWYFMETVDDGTTYLQLYPYAGEGKAMGYPDTDNGAAKIVAASLESTGYCFEWLLETTDGGAPYGLQTSGRENRLSNNSGVGFKMGLWNASPSSDAGSAMYFMDPAAAMMEVINKAKELVQYGGTNPGCYTEESVVELNVAISAAEESYNANNYSVDALNEAINALVLIMPEAGKCYVIECPLFYNTQSVNKGLYVTDNAAPGWNTINLADKNYYWTVEVSEGTYALKNVGTETYLNGTSMSESAVYGNLNSVGQLQFNIVVSGTTVHANGHSSGSGSSGNIVSWGGTANSASAWQFIEQADPDLTVAIATLQNRIDELNEMITYTGTNPGEYKAEETAGLVEPIAAAQAVLNGGSELSTTYEEALETLNEAISGLDLAVNPVTAGTYRIVSAANCFAEQKGITCYARDEYYGNRYYPGWASVNENDPLQYWTLEEADNGTFYIKAAYEGNYITTATTLTETAAVVTFTSLGSAQFNINLNGQLHCNGWNWNGVTQAALTTWSGDVDSPSAWKLVAVSEEPVFNFDLTVGEAGYSTLMLAYNAEIPTGVTCYTAVVNGGYAQLTAVEGDVLPAKTPVIVEAEAETYTFNSTTAVVKAANTENELVGTLYPKLIAADAYVLANGANGVGFYKAVLNKDANGAEGNTHFLNNANKAYLPVSSSTAAPMLSLGRGEGTTSIDNAQLTNDNELVIYDLAGRRVQKMEKGIYIVNGKKVIR